MTDGRRWYDKDPVLKEALELLKLNKSRGCRLYFKITRTGCR